MSSLLELRIRLRPNTYSAEEFQGGAMIVRVRGRGGSQLFEGPDGKIHAQRACLTHAEEVSRMRSLSEKASKISIPLAALVAVDGLIKRRPMVVLSTAIAEPLVLLGMQGARSLCNLTIRDIRAEMIAISNSKQNLTPLPQEPKPQS